MSCSITRAYVAPANVSSQPRLPMQKQGFVLVMFRIVVLEKIRILVNTMHQVMLFVMIR